MQRRQVGLSEGRAGFKVVFYHSRGGSLLLTPQLSVEGTQETRWTGEWDGNLLGLQSLTGRAGTSSRVPSFEGRRSVAPP